jgi:UDP-N-acetylglucosamine 2-epimerase
VNVGIRQSGRERGRNVLDCRANRAEIAGAIDLALSPSFAASLHDLKNPYGDGNSSARIAQILGALDLSESLLNKAPSRIDLHQAAL